MDANATTRISGLVDLNLADLRAEYEKVFGKPTQSRNRKQLFSQIARRLQGQENGAAPSGQPTLVIGLKKKPRQGQGAGRSKNTTREKTGKMAAKGESRKPAPAVRDPRLPKVGTSLERTYKGHTLLVRVLADGFEYDGATYRSLSALAKHITGQIVNGFVWFRLGLPGQGKKSA